MKSMKRRTILKAGLGFPAIVSSARAQGSKQVSILTWNIPNARPLMEEWIKEFMVARPGVAVQWLDKKGPDLPAFYQTQLVAGTPPDVIDIQGGLGVEYAAQGALLDLTPMLTKHPDVKARFNADYLENWVYDGKNYMLPFYISKTLLFYNKALFQKAGVAGPPDSFDAILDHASKIKGDNQTGFLTLNFDWLYWPLYKMNAIELLTPDLKHTAFDTPRMISVTDQLAKGTASGAVDKISWTGRWVEPLGAFSSGRVGMLHAHAPAYLYIKGQGPWVNQETLGIAQMPGGWAVPNSHGLGISAQSSNKDLAWELLSFLTEKKQSLAFARFFKVLTGNDEVDQILMADMRKDDPLGASVLETQLQFTDRMTGNWRLGDDSQVKDAFYPNLQAGLLGNRPVPVALNAAKRAVGRVLERG